MTERREVPPLKVRRLLPPTGVVRRRWLPCPPPEPGLNVPQRCDPDLRSALGGTRTPNLLIRSQMLYPLSYERWKGELSRFLG